MVSLPQFAGRRARPRRLVAALLVAVMAGAPAAAERITVFAAASLAGVLDTVAAGFEAAQGHAVVVSHAGSSTLARQIARGAPADVFISADTAWMDWLAERGHLVPGTRRALLGNRIVVIAPAMGGASLTLDALPERLGRDGRLAMALVDAVPAGRYGKAALQNLGLWDSLAPRVAQADNVRAALALVAQGAAPFGIVYATDAAASDRVRVVARIPARAHPPITYPVAALGAAERPAVAAFRDYLHGPAAREAFAAAGFTAPAR